MEIGGFNWMEYFVVKCIVLCGKFFENGFGNVDRYFR